MELIVVRKSVKIIPVMLLAAVLCIASCIPTFASSTEKTVVELLDDYQALISSLESSGANEETVDSEKQKYENFRINFYLIYDSLNRYLVTLNTKYGLIDFPILNGGETSFAVLEQYARDFLVDPDSFFETSVDVEDGHFYDDSGMKHYREDSYYALLKYVEGFIGYIDGKVPELKSQIERLQGIIDGNLESYSYSDLEEITADDMIDYNDDLN